MPRIDPRDLVAQGDPETVVLLPDGGSLVGLLIRGVEGHTMIGIREDECGRPESIAVGIVVEIAPHQSNPRRLGADTGEDE